MVQMNLLPDVKQEFVKVNRTKRTVVAIAVLVSVIMLVIFFLVFAWDGLQKKNLSDINRDISTNKSSLTSMSNLNKILTIQNQLNSLPALNNQKPVASRLFNYLSEITPTDVTISTLSVNFAQHTATINGQASGLATVNTFADTLKFATYSIAGQSGQPKNAFSSVVLSSFSVTDTSSSYTFSFDFDPNLFNSSDQTTLTVPAGVTTRSVTDQPTDLFKKPTTTAGN